MDILLDNPLATMAGPYFLLLYGLVIFFTLVILGIIKSRIDDTHELPLPSIPANIDPYEIAYLRGGVNEVTRSVVFSLMQKGLIEMQTDAKKTQIRKTENQANATNLNHLEQLAFGWFNTPRDATEVFKAGGLVKQFEAQGRTYQARLESLQMLTGDELTSTFKPMKWTAYLVIFGLGAYKAPASIAHGYYNIIFLLIFLIVGLLIARSIARFSRLTKLGKAYLERLQLAFDNLKLEAQRAYIPSSEPRVAPSTTFAGVDPLLLSGGVRR